MKFLLSFALLLVSLVSCSQTTQELNSQSIDKTKKIKVYLLGTFHFAQTDDTYNVLDEQHQNSIAELCDIIAKQKPNKIFVERQPEFEFQNKIDSLFKVYLNMTRPLKSKNEIYQVGFRVAKMLGHEKVYQCDHPGRYSSLNSVTVDYAERHNQSDILDAKRIGTVERYDEMVDEDSIMKNATLLEYMQFLNSDEIMNTSHAFYITSFPQVGSKNFYDYDDENTLIGAELTVDWYRRNIMIYTKMINQVDYNNDKAIFLLMGGDHIPIIKNLFDANPYFEVIQTDKWLN